MSVLQELSNLLELEKKRLNSTINLIASENYCAPEVRDLTGSVLCSKYAEGAVGKRFYGGCVVVDQIEQLAIDQARNLFGAEYVNVQPHSGTDANLIAYNALLNPGDKILAMSMDAGGHLSHGHKMNLSSKLYDFDFYGVDPESHLIDYQAVQKKAEEARPNLIVAGGSSYPRSIDFAKFSQIAKSVNAFLMIDMSHFAGLVAAKMLPSPVPYADIVTSTTHKTLRGPRGAIILAKDNLARAINRSVMPGVQGGPHVNSIAAKAQAFWLAGQNDFVDYQKRVVSNAKKIAEVFSREGFDVISGGTDTHMVLVDVFKSTKVNGRKVERELESIGIVLNRNVVPYDSNSAFHPSGIRIGTPAITSQGCGLNLAQRIASLLVKSIFLIQAEQELVGLSGEVEAIVSELTPIA